MSHLSATPPVRVHISAYPCTLCSQSSSKCSSDRPRRTDTRALKGHLNAPPPNRLIVAHRYTDTQISRGPGTRPTTCPRSPPAALQRDSVARQDKARGPSAHVESQIQRRLLPAGPSPAAPAPYLRLAPCHLLAMPLTSSSSSSQRTASPSPTTSTLTSRPRL